jgi:DNA modification methylase
MWYRYYAGYSTEFVTDMMRALDIKQGHSVLDPWMGSGTTLAVVGSHNAMVAGLDLNPAMAVIAKGRLIAVDTEESVEPLMTQVSQHWRPVAPASTDLLTSWFTTEAAANVRGLVARIDDVLVKQEADVLTKASRMSSIAAFYYVAAFRTVTRRLGTFASRNPTWVKRNHPGDGTVEFKTDDLTREFEESVRHLATFIRYRKPIPVKVRDHCEVRVGDSRMQPFADDQFDAVIASPPYLTRLDYVVGHLPELATLGLEQAHVDDLRRSMIGTPKITAGEAKVPLGTKAKALIEQVEVHDSYAAKSYYAKNFKQYFEGMADSLGEIGRVTKPSRHVALVVQDSHFKEVRIDLADILADQATGLGWSYIGRKDFVNIRSMAQLNTRAHETARTTKPTETVLLMKTD